LNCHRVRKSISPYLDEQLTGREMLDLQEHFAHCPSCAAEMRSIREVKALLRGLHTPRPRSEMAARIALRLAETENAPPLWQSFLPPPRPQRGRRLATALAFSCLTVFAFAAPFAPPSRDGVRAAWLPARFSPPPPSSALPPLPDAVNFVASPAASRAGLVPWNSVSDPNGARTFAGPDVASPLPDWTLTPRFGAFPLSASFTSYRTR